MINLIISIILGMIIGSFLSVCIYRIPKEESLIYPGSYCVECGHALSFLDLVPIISFLSLEGRCRYCGKKISAFYLYIEVMTGLVFGIVYLRFRFSIEGLMYAVFAGTLITLTMIDREYMLLPTKVIGFGGFIGVVFRICQSVMSREVNILIEAILTAFLGYVLFCSLFYFSKLILKKEGLGFGDVRLIGMLGLYLSLSQMFFTLLLASLLALIYGLFLLWKKKVSEPFPFGPFINFGALVAVFYGNFFISWYLRCQ